jgi:hypothetical protein
MTSLRKKPHLLWLTLIIILVACQNDPSAQAVTNTAAPPTAIIENEVTETAVPPTLAATATLEPTLEPPPTLTPLPSPTPAPTATSTPEIVTLLTMEEFGEDRNPFTGERVEDPSVLQRRPIACKLSNYPGKYTRPQAGINDADIVYEHITLWVISRFTAIFYDTLPPAIGPVRSGRLIDIEIPAMYDSAFCFSGSHPVVSQRMFRSDIAGQIIRPNEEGYYRIDNPDIPSEHTFYADPVGLHNALAIRDLDHPPQLRNNMAFSTVPPDGGQAVTKFTVDFGDVVADWEYQPENNRYWRWTDGEIHRDANTQEQVNFQNVVVVFTPHVNSDICVYANEAGECTNFSVEIQIWGSGPVTIFRDGMMYEGIWKREDRHHMLTFYTNEGEVIPLQIGNSMFEVVIRYWSNQLIINE